MPNGEDTPVIPKREESREDAASSLESPTHEDDQTLDIREAESHSGVAEGSPVQKRRGGRKPLYQTTEEKKQRNRRAQAAFRERRTEHIKQLEADKRHLEERVESMEAGQRKDQDENLMLRYKNSLLERVLVEHDIDFRFEIRKKGAAYSPPQAPQTLSQIPAHRTVLRRPRPKPLAVDTVSPGLIRSDSNATASVASASPVVPTSASFTFRSPVQLPQSATGQTPASQAHFVQGLRQSSSMSNIPDLSLPQRRQSIPSAWPLGFDAGAQQQQQQPPQPQQQQQQPASSFPLEHDSFAVHSSSPLLAGQFAGPAGGQQFGIVGGGQFPQGASSINQMIESDSTVVQNMDSQTSQTGQGLGHAYAMMGGNLSAFNQLQVADPFGIDQSMQYPTQFDYPGRQKK